MNLIDRDHLLKKANEEQQEGLITDDDLEVVYYELADEPTIDAVPVIRCKDCKHWDDDACFVDAIECTSDDIILDRFDYDFCSRAERKEE